MKRYSPPPATPPRIFLRKIPRGYPGTMRTASHVKRLIREGAKDFYVRQKAIDILLERGVRPKNYLGEIAALFEWVQRNVRYTRDPFRVEVLHTPRRMLELRAGDCDDMTILLGSMLESVGHPVRLVLTGPNAFRPRLFSHIYLEVNHRGDWIPCDATMPHPLGWSPRAPVKQIIAIQEEPSHVNHTAGAGLAAGTDTRHRARGRPAERPAGAAALEPAARPGTAREERMAPHAPPLRVGEGAGHPPTSPDHAAAQGAAEKLGNPAAGDRGDDAGRRDPARVPPAAAAQAGEGAAGRTGTSAGAAPGAALSGFLREGADVLRVSFPRVIPPVLIQLGDLVGLIYRSDKWQDGAPRTYIHFMRQRPRLLCDTGGRQLFLVGGSYRVTRRGIEG
jgi:hypothetical protein